MSKRGLIQGIGQAASAAAEDIGERLKRDRIAARQAVRDKSINDMNTASQDKQNAFTSSLQEDRQAHEMEMSKGGLKNNGAPAGVLTHRFLTDQLKSDDPQIVAAAEHALGISDKAKKNDERVIQGYMEMFMENQTLNRTRKGDEGYMSIEDMRQASMDMMGINAEDSAPDGNGILMKHPDYGDITEDWIQNKMNKHGASRDEIMRTLGVLGSGKVIRN